MLHYIPLAFGWIPIIRRESVYISVPLHDGTAFGLAKAGSRCRQRVEHGLQIEGRAAYDLEYVGGGGLLLQRLAQLLEQPRVLDGDDSLRCETGEQPDLFIGKWTNFLAIDDDDSNQFIIFEHRHSDAGSNPTEFDGFHDCRVAVGIRLCCCTVGGLDRLLGSDQLAKGATRGGTERTLSARVGKCPRHIVAGDEA